MGRVAELRDPPRHHGRGDDQGHGFRRAAGDIGASDPGAGDLVDPMPHRVQSGENFWTISRLYYGSGRFYKALWKANSDQVPAPEQLRVGQTIRVPPPEELDRSLVIPPRSASAAESDPSPSMHHASRPVLGDGDPSPPSEVELALPVSDPFHDRVGASHVPERRRLVVYKIRPHETLRSIARDTLGNSRRADEILELNRGVIDDPHHLTPGQIIDLPEDARLARRARSSAPAGLDRNARG